MSIRTSTYSFLGDLRHKPTTPPTPPATLPKPAPNAAPSPKPLDPVEAQQLAAAALLARLAGGNAENAPDTFRVPVPQQVRSLRDARLLARARGTHAEMRALGIPEEEIARYLDPANPSYRPPEKKAPAAPAPTEVHFGPQTAPAPIPAAPRPEEVPPAFVQAGVRPVLGQLVHYVDANPKCKIGMVEEAFRGFLAITGSADTIDPVVRLCNPKFGKNAISEKTTYVHDANPPAERSPYYKPTWHRSSECPFEKA